MLKWASLGPLGIATAKAEGPAAGMNPASKGLWKTQVTVLPFDGIGSSEGGTLRQTAQGKLPKAPDEGTNAPTVNWDGWENGWKDE